MRVPGQPPAGLSIAAEATVPRIAGKSALVARRSGVSSLQDRHPPRPATRPATPPPHPAPRDADPFGDDPPLSPEGVAGEAGSPAPDSMRSFGGNAFDSVDLSALDYPPTPATPPETPPAAGQATPAAAAAPQPETPPPSAQAAPPGGGAQDAGRYPGAGIARALTLDRGREDGEPGGLDFDDLMGPEPAPPGPAPEPEGAWARGGGAGTAGRAAPPPLAPPGATPQPWAGPGPGAPPAAGPGGGPPTGPPGAGARQQVLPGDAYNQYGLRNPPDANDPGNVVFSGVDPHGRGGQDPSQQFGDNTPYEVVLFRQRQRLLLAAMGLCVVAFAWWLPALVEAGKAGSPVTLTVLLILSGPPGMTLVFFGGLKARSVMLQQQTLTLHLLKDARKWMNRGIICFGVMHVVSVVALITMATSECDSSCSHRNVAVWLLIMLNLTLVAIEFLVDVLRKGLRSISKAIAERELGTAARATYSVA